MLPDSWLGRYGFGIDEEDGIHRLDLWRADDGTVLFDHDYKCHTNHGYSLSRSKGVVLGVDDRAILVELREGSSASWEDWYKEDSRGQLTEPVKQEIRIVRIEDGHPVLMFERGTELVFIPAKS